MRFYAWFNVDVTGAYVQSDSEERANPVKNQPNPVAKVTLLMMTDDDKMIDP